MNPLTSSRYAAGPHFSECPRCAQFFCCSGVIGVGVSPAGTELHPIVSSNLGAEPGLPLDQEFPLNR
jgi:hypothetical protein